MCPGTRCDHHLNPAIEELEAPYSKWVETPREQLGDEANGLVYWIVHQYVGNHPSGPGPQAWQPMFTIKDDTWDDEKTDDDATLNLWCFICEDRRATGGHQCGCGVPQMHREAYTLCLECWDYTLTAPNASLLAYQAQRAKERSQATE